LQQHPQNRNATSKREMKVPMQHQKEKKEGFVVSKDSYNKNYNKHTQY
jgi:hypothetical protein